MPPENFLARLFSKLTSRNNKQQQTVSLEISDNYTVEVPAQYPKELLDSLRSLIGTEGNEMLLLEAVNLITAGKAPAEAVCEHLVYRKHISANSWVAGQLLASIHWYRQLPYMDDYSKADPLLHAQIAGLLVASNKLYKEDQLRQKQEEYDTLPLTDGNSFNYVGYPVIGITSNDIVHLVLEYPERAQDITEIMISRHTSDASFIRSIMRTETPAIASGIL